jgi:hypothetical protein
MAEWRGCIERRNNLEHIVYKRLRERHLEARRNAR